MAILTMAILTMDVLTTGMALFTMVILTICQERLPHAARNGQGRDAGGRARGDIQGCGLAASGLCECVTVCVCVTVRDCTRAIVLK